jgi:hypothetical protein
MIATVRNSLATNWFGQKNAPKSAGLARSRVALSTESCPELEQTRRCVASFLLRDPAPPAADASSARAARELIANRSSYGKYGISE